MPPAGERAGHPVWRLADALPALTGRGAGKAPLTGKADAPPPPGFAWLDGMAPHDALAALALMLLAYRLPPAVASLAVASGAPCRAAFAASEAFKVLAMQLVAEVARECSLPPWTDNPDPPVTCPEGFEAVNWPALAEAAGEPLDPEAWAAWARERFAA